MAWREMKKHAVSIALLLLVLNPAYATSAEPIVTELEDKIIVEYSGSGQASTATPARPATPSQSTPAAKRVKDLASAIQQLVAKGNEIARFDGSESASQLQAKRAQLDQILIQLRPRIAELERLWADNKQQLQQLSGEVAQLGEYLQKFLETTKLAYLTTASAESYPSKRAAKSEDVKVCCISSFETERSYNYVTYSIKADIDNRGPEGKVYVKLVAKNRNGHQMDSVYLKATMGRNESRTLTATTMLTYQQALDARTWEVESIDKY